ncbi:hypothetical protein THTE_3377 [Thermogutta terrifontis]|uniref:Uncharacterized protein n=1 Tax=Thermogutta terrifontis TaxID=1331910 RepID=A0A286RJ37_9BACT|nr:hypothetical protein THTE_3377 [Thermogutta terrifontis]
MPRQKASAFRSILRGTLFFQTLLISADFHAVWTMPRIQLVTDKFDS